jgi:hypothetical protein
MVINYMIGGACISFANEPFEGRVEKGVDKLLI